MVTARARVEVPPVIYPDSDGEPMAENTVQYEWIVKIKGNLDTALSSAFVAGDLFWYPIEGDPGTRLAPDVLVALDRPKGHRSSYLQWMEGHPPEVVFEIWSPGNTFRKKTEKLLFYNRHGVREFYAYDPEINELTAYIRGENGLDPVDVSDGYVSPLLGVRFEPGAETLTLRAPDGAVFRTFAEIVADAAAAERRANQAEQQAAEAQQQAAEAQQQAANAAARAEALAARLRALGLDPDGS